MLVDLSLHPIVGLFVRMEEHEQSVEKIGELMLMIVLQQNVSEFLFLKLLLVLQ
jgi:hypothetical protein